MADASLPSVIKMAQFIVSNQARTQFFRRGGRGGGGVHFKLERTSCQLSLKYLSLYNTECARLYHT